MEEENQPLETQVGVLQVGAGTRTVDQRKAQKRLLEQLVSLISYRREHNFDRNVYFKLSIKQENLNFTIHIIIR